MPGKPKSKKVRLVMLNDMPSFWKKGDKRRVKAEFVDTLVNAGWAKMLEEGDLVKPEVKK